MKKILVWALIIGAAAGGYYFWQMNKPPEDPTKAYITEPSEIRDIEKIVSVTGSIKPKEVVEIRATMNELVNNIFVNEGDKIGIGGDLFQFDYQVYSNQINQAEYQLDQSQANYEMVSAHARNEDIRLAQKDIEVAQVALESVERNLDQTKSQLDIDIEIAELQIENLKSEIDVIEKEKRYASNQTVTNEETSENNTEALLNSAKLTYSQTWDSLEKTRILANQILKQDNISHETERYSGIAFGQNDQRLLNSAKHEYDQYKYRFNTFDSEFRGAENSWQNAQDGLVYISEMQKMVRDSETFLSLVRDIAEGRSRGGSASAVSAAQAELVAHESTLNSIVNSLELSSQNIEKSLLSTQSTENQTDSSLVAYDSRIEGIENQIKLQEQNIEKIKNQSETAIVQLESEIASREVSLERAELSYNRVVASPRAVETNPQKIQIDIASAQVDLAKLNFNKTAIKSPISGIVSEVYARTGMLPPVDGVMVRVSSEEQELVANVSEADIDDIATGLKATVTFDSFSEDEIFEAVVSKIDREETVIQGVIYYQVTFEIESEEVKDRILSGMTTNIDVVIAQKEKVLSIDPTTITYDEGTAFAKILTKDEAGNPLIEKREIALGLEGDSYTEVKEGIEENEEVILYKEEK